jgi:hypothetical protein
LSRCLIIDRNGLARQQILMPERNSPTKPPSFDARALFSKKLLFNARRVVFSLRLTAQRTTHHAHALLIRRSGLMKRVAALVLGLEQSAEEQSRRCSGFKFSVKENLPFEQRRLFCLLKTQSGGHAEPHRKTAALVSSCVLARWRDNSARADSATVAG